MSRPKPQWQLQALAAQRRDNELRRAEELRKVANYYESNTNKTKHHEQWTTEGYYERANKEAEILNQKKIRAAKLEERRKKLEQLLYQENLQYQQELKKLASQPKLFKNGSYLNKVPTSTLKEINQGIMEKEEQLRRHEAELRLHHAWRLRQPELRAANTYVTNGKLKSAWMEQIVEKELQKKKDEEETRKCLQERDEALRRQIKMEEERLKEKEQQMKDIIAEQEKCTSYKRIIDAALQELEECREKERQRQKNIEAMYDGEARQINEKQDKLWAKEREARSILMKEVILTLQKQLEDKIEAGRELQRANVLERESILQDMEDFHKQVRAKERDTQLKNTEYSTIAALQSQLNSLKVQKEHLDEAAEREADIRAAIDHERNLRTEIARMQRAGNAQAWS
ncbi:trichoplein keratin filament-binding protein-like isoform X2 [Battus philenor]|uniref:trichoplein keratin filament-binding protein-like isoform X2 n=1 Tax=Battus philenor TaxID=42288 RepID=UPI0035D0CE9C